VNLAVAAEPEPRRASAGSGRRLRRPRPQAIGRERALRLAIERVEPGPLTSRTRCRGAYVARGRSVALWPAWCCRHGICAANRVESDSSSAPVRREISASAAPFRRRWGRASLAAKFAERSPCWPCISRCTSSQATRSFRAIAFLFPARRALIERTLLVIKRFVVELDDVRRGGVGFPTAFRTGSTRGRRPVGRATCSAGRSHRPRSVAFAANWWK